jgi:hypothetical protein
MANIKKSKSMDKMPARKMPEGVEFPKTKKPAPKKPAVKRPASKPAPLPKPKPKPKPKVVQMPSKINPFKMTPAQKAQYLKNPERYDG